MSTRTIAKTLGVGRQIVRDDLGGGLYNPPEIVTGSDGKHYPSQQPRPSPAPHVAHNSGENEWYTPAIYVEAARRAMGSIDLDPASSHLANKTVRANVYYTAEDNGLTQEWYGNVWMNPPYSQPLIAQFSNTVADKYDCGDIEQACVLVNNATETSAFQRMLESCACVCFLRTRVKFVDMNGVASGAPLQGQAILYFGKNTDAFCKEFSDMGRILHAR
jgi:ParB family chromosome partitioning protein